MKFFLISALLILLTYCGYLSFQSIDWDVLRRLETSSISVPKLEITPTPYVTPTPLPKKAR